MMVKQNGMDLDLIKTFKIISPIIFVGGVGKLDHVKSAYDAGFVLVEGLLYCMVIIGSISAQMRKF